MAIDSTKPTVVVESSALPSGASTEATLALIKAKTDNLDVALSTRTKPADQQHAIVDSSVLPTGAATEATLATRLSESDFDAKTGSLTESAPASDTASSGLNGRLQRIAQRITSLIALLPAALGAGGGLKVDGSGTALPVSGTVTANAGSGTLAVSLASVPSHDVTNAGSFAAQITSHVPGTAATNLGKAEDAVAASGDTGVAVLAVRRDAAASGVSADGDYANLSVDSNGALRVTGGGGGTQYNLDDVASATATGTVALVVRKDSAASLAGTDGDITGLQVDASGALRVTGGGGGTEYTEDAAAAANPAGQMLILRRKDTLSSAEVSADGDNIAANATAKGELYVKHTDAVAVTNANLDAALSTLLTQSDFDSKTGSLTEAAPASDTASSGLNGRLQRIAQRLTSLIALLPAALGAGGGLKVDGSGTALPVADSQVIADDAAFTPGTSKVFMAGFEADESSTDSVDEGDAGAARMTLDRKLIVTLQPHTAGGWDVFMASSGDGSTPLTNTAQAVKASAGKLGGWYIYNPNASATYVIIYNVASGSVTVGTTNPKMVLAIPATSAANIEFANGITFDTAIAVAATTTGGGSTAPATALEANFLYK